MAAVDLLGYVPNLAASSLASRRSGILAVLVPTIGNSIFSETVRGVADAVEAANLHLLIGDFGYSAEKRRKLVRAQICCATRACPSEAASRCSRLRAIVPFLAILPILGFDIISRSSFE